METELKYLLGSYHSLKVKSRKMPVAADRAHSMSVSRFWNLGQSYASDIFISNVKHSRADYNLCWNVLRSVAYSESCTFRNKGKIFPGSIWSV